MSAGSGLLSQMRSVHEEAIESIIQATESARIGNPNLTSNYLHQAKMYADLCARRMRAQGRHKEAEAYIGALNEHMNRVNRILNHTQVENRKEKIEKAKSAQGNIRKKEEHSEKCDSVLNKEGACNCSFMQKGLLNPYTTEKPARKEYNPSGKVKSTEQPMKKQSTALVPKVEGSSYAETNAEHRKGAAVRIDKPGHRFHGKMGIVRGESPHLPGQIGVQIGPTETSTVYVSHQFVKPTKPLNKIEKALISHFNIQKAFFK